MKHNKRKSVFLSKKKKNNNKKGKVNKKKFTSDTMARAVREFERERGFTFKGE